jgi:hypothetical protein
MRTPISIALLTALLLAIPVIAGCGDGAEQVSSAELVQRADQICTEERDRFDQIQSAPPPSASAAVDQTGDLIDATESAISDLRDIEPPESQRDTYDGYLNARDEVVDEMKKGKEAAEDRDTAAYGAAQDAVAKGAAERQKLAAELGFKVCSQSAKAP